MNKEKIVRHRECFESKGKKWHFFGDSDEIFKEGQKCNCGEMIIKKGLVTKITNI